MKHLLIIIALLGTGIGYAQPKKEFKNGTFGVKSEGVISEGYTIVRKGRRQKENFQGTKAVFKVKWISDSSYRLTMIREDKPGEFSKTLHVDIIETREDEYTAIVVSDFGTTRVTLFRRE
ncbi:MAG: hypothetical protein NXI10_09210 [bacterium]|nr:hypothetical protein [bacterium]